MRESSLFTIQDALDPILESMRLLPARENTYPNNSEITPLELPSVYAADDIAYTAAAEYFQAIIPNIGVTPLSNEGSNAIVMNDSHFVYKVFRGVYEGYGKIENEAAALSVLGREGISPNLVGLLDSTLPSRLAPQDRRGDYSPLFGSKIMIPRIETAGQLPVIIAERRHIAGIQELPTDILGREFNRFAQAALKHNLIYNDCRFHYDEQHNQAVVVDVGDVFQPSKTGRSLFHASEGPEDLSRYTHEQIWQAWLISDVFGHFAPGAVNEVPNIEQTAKILETHGLDGLHPLLHKCRENASI